MKKNKDYKFIVILLVILFIVISTNFILKDTLNIFLENIFFTNDKNIIIKDSFINNYINSLEKDISEYKEISSLKDCISASVIYRNPSFWYDEITINKGSKDNIKKNSVVINNEGLVGIVTDVFSNTSNISLITNINKNKKITVGINNEDNITYGLISGYDRIKNEIIVSEVTSDIEYKDNMNIFTTSFTNTFKEGIIIGNVIEINNDYNGLSKNIAVKPVVDYNDMKYVCVINK